MENLSQMKCVGCEGGIAPLTLEEAQILLKNLHQDWKMNESNTAISRSISFKGFRKVIEFVNALAWIVNREMHHPELHLGYDFCEVTFTTHAIHGLSKNDFICAAKMDELF